MTVQPHATRPTSHLFGCLGFWLWALVGAATIFAFISFIGWLFLVPAAIVGYRLTRRWAEGPVMLGLVAGAGLPLLLVAALQWDSWHHRVTGDNTPNPYYWGGVGICLVVAGMAAFALARRRTD